MAELADHFSPGFGKFLKKMVSIKLAISAIATLVLPLTFLFVVIFRYILHLDLFAYEEWLLPISFWLYFLASGVGSYENSQIRADIFGSYFKTARSIWLRRVCLSLVETIISVVVVYWAVLMVIDEIQAYPYWLATTALQIPYLVPRVGILIGLFFMAFYGFLHLYVLIKKGDAIVVEELAQAPKEERVA